MLILLNVAHPLIIMQEIMVFDHFNYKIAIITAGPEVGQKHTLMLYNFHIHTDYPHVFKAASLLLLSINQRSDSSVPSFLHSVSLVYLFTSMGATKSMSD